MDLTSLKDARVLVAGASAGIGRNFAAGAVRAGARVVLAARRAEELEKLRAEAGGGIPVVTDLTSDDDCARLAETIGSELGGLDVVVSCVGAAPLKLVADTADEDWRRLFETNVLSVNRLLRRTLPLLDRSAMVLALSSESVYQPRPGIGAYSTSKAALERLIEAWRVEHPWLRFTNVVIGATMPTDFGNEFDGELLGHVLTDWISRGLAQEEFMSPSDVAEVLLGVVASGLGKPGVCMEQLVLRSPSPVVDASGHPLPSRPPVDGPA
ncbi:SDR family oxidoreductase [Actinocorallia libanotica]|uniref:SDR family oxidoreductase n=1 Tax=Actinocorallia libanotica TaxID=46162 RepID=A0ABN1QIR3_9ACTN